MKERIFANYLREKMKHSVPKKLLASIPDEKLIQHYNEHHQQKLERFKQSRAKRGLTQVLERASA